MSTVLYVKVLEKEMRTKTTKQTNKQKMIDEGSGRERSYIGDLMGTKQSVDAPLATMPIHYNRQLHRTV